jgi:hypothetical protein
MTLLDKILSNPKQNKKNKNKKKREEKAVHQSIKYSEKRP